MAFTTRSCGTPDPRRPPRSATWRTTARSSSSASSQDRSSTRSPSTRERAGTPRSTSPSPTESRARPAHKRASFETNANPTYKYIPSRQSSHPPPLRLSQKGSNIQSPCSSSSSGVRAYTSSAVRTRFGAGSASLPSPAELAPSDSSLPRPIGVSACLSRDQLAVDHDELHLPSLAQNLKPDALLGVPPLLALGAQRLAGSAPLRAGGAGGVAEVSPAAHRLNRAGQGAAPTSRSRAKGLTCESENLKPVYALWVAGQLRPLTRTRGVTYNPRSAATPQSPLLAQGQSRG